MRKHQTTLAVALASVLFLLAPVSVAASPVAPLPVVAAGGLTVPVTGTTSKGGQFTGTFNITNFALDTATNTVTATGKLTGNVTDAAGRILRSVTSFVSAIVDMSRTSGSCPILHLVLGPINLDLLGLVVTTNQIVVDITAQAGGGLLGDLLCIVANLLSSGGLLDQLVVALNNLLAAL